MPLKELFRVLNVMRMKLNLPLVSEERFIEEISVMQLLGKLKGENGIVRT